MNVINLATEREAPLDAPLSTARSMSAGEAALRRAAALSGPAFDLGGDLAVTLQPARPPAFSAQSVLSLQVDGRIAHLALSAAAKAALLEVADLPAGACEEDAEIAVLALEHALAAAFDGFERAAGATAQVVGWSAAPEGEELETIWIGGALRRGQGDAALVALGVAEADATAAAAWLSRRPLTPANDRALWLVAGLRFAAFEVAAEEADALRRGDVLFGDFDWNEMRLSFGGGIWRSAMSEDGSVTVHEPEAMDHEYGLEPIGGGLDAADVTVSVEVARARLPLETARSVGPGFVLPLGRAVGSEVELYVADRPFARGRLVEIDGELGVEILSVG